MLVGGVVKRFSDCGVLNFFWGNLFLGKRKGVLGVKGRVSPPPFNLRGFFT